MNIYIIDQEKRLGASMARLVAGKKAILLENKSHDVRDYRPLFSDKSEKVLAVNPTSIDWKFPSEDLEEIPNLRSICTKSSWAYYIDMSKTKEMHVSISNCIGANSQSVAEYAVWMMLGLAKRLPMQLKDGFQYHWDDKHVQTEIMGKTAGIVGLGNVGSRIARMCQGLGMKVVYWNRSPKDVSYRKCSDVDRLIKTADVVFNCLEDCEGTRGFLGKKRLAKMKKSAYFVSVLGGMGFGVEDDLYLVEAVAKGKIAGFAIENEHNHGFKLPKEIRGNVLVVAAYAWFSREAQERTDKMWAECAVAAAKGKPINVVEG